jgi:hypothetical protein
MTSANPEIHAALRNVLVSVVLLEGFCMILVLYKTVRYALGGIADETDHPVVGLLKGIRYLSVREPEGRSLPAHLLLSEIHTSNLGINKTEVQP